MDFEKLTEKSRTFLQQAQTLATRSDHQSLEPEHLLKVMLDDEDKIIPNLVKAGGANLSQLKQDVNAAIAKFPAVTGGGAGAQVRC